MKSSSPLLASATLPLLCYLALVVSAVHTYIHFGHWPSYGNPDPHHLPIYRFASIAMLTGLATTALIPFFGLLRACICSPARKDSPTVLWIAGICYGIGAILWTVDFVRHRSGMGGLVDWIAD